MQHECGNRRSFIVGITTRNTATAGVNESKIKVRRRGWNTKHLDVPHAGARQAVSDKEHLPDQQGNARKLVGIPPCEPSLRKKRRGLAGDEGNVSSRNIPTRGPPKSVRESWEKGPPGSPIVSAPQVLVPAIGTKRRNCGSARPFAFDTGKCNEAGGAGHKAIDGGRDSIASIVVSARAVWIHMRTHPGSPWSANEVTAGHPGKNSRKTKRFSEIACPRVVLQLGDAIALDPTKI
jgi:hypothetical protein